MLSIDKDGVVRDARVKVELISQISHGPLLLIDAIVVHQTASPTAKGTLAEYRTAAAGLGAHFLIDKDGTTYQTVSIKQKCWHVGPIYSKCYERHSCAPKEKQFYDQLKVRIPFHSFVHEVDHHEEAKNILNAILIIQTLSVLK